jgi:hypothetical protein
MNRTQPTRLGLINRISGAQTQGKESGLQQEMVIVDPRWVGAPGANGSFPPPTGDPDLNYAVTKIGNMAGYTLGGPPTLTSALTSGTSYTSLPVSPLGAALYQGQVIVLVSGGSGGLVQSWTVSANASVGASTISVTSQHAAFNFPIGTIVSGAASSAPGFGIAMWRQSQVLTSALTAGSSYTAMSCTAFLTGLSAGAPAGALVTTIQPGPVPAVSQTWTLYSAASVGATTLQVTSLPLSSPQTAETAQATFPIGSLIGIWLPL